MKCRPVAPGMGFNRDKVSRAMFRDKFGADGRYSCEHPLALGVTPGVMKTLLLALSLAAAGASAVNAQVYQPAVVNGSILGGIAGAIIGGHNHDRWGEGAIIGAAAGALLGATVQQPRTMVYEQPPVTVVQTAPVVAPAATVPMAPSVSTAPVFAAPAPQQVVVSQPAQVVYVPYYASAPVVYETYPAYPVVRLGVGFGYGWAPRHSVYVRSGHRRW